jgi:flavin reductase (DIM6/NTAB) family NADH-FMN oxidoreductase RutF
VPVLDPATDTPARRPGPLSPLVVPRPVTRISTADADGVVPVAPFRDSLPLTGQPMLLAVSTGTRREVDGAAEHTDAHAVRAHAVRADA